MQMIKQKTTIMIAGLSDLKDIEMKKVFVIADPFLIGSESFDLLEKALKDKEVQVFSEITPDPPIAQVAQGIIQMQKIMPDTIIAIGGGSAIDAAKGMKYFYQKILGKKAEQLSFIAIPTTSGTGSEVTSFSIITDPKKGTKYPLVTDEILPDIALLDVNLVKTVPPRITADTGMDVLTHCLEAYVSINANAFSDLYAEKAFELVFKYLPLCFENGDNEEAREKMHIASTLAGLAFNSAGLGLNHGIAHAAGARFHVPHGRMNAILLPDLILYNAGLDEEKSLDEQTIKRYASLAKRIGIEVFQSKQAVKSLVVAIKRLRRNLKMPERLTEYGLDKQEVLIQLDEVVQAAQADSCTSTNPRIPSNEEIAELIKKIL